MTTNKPATILVVEDEGIIAEDLAASLRKMGYDVPLTANSGEEALTLMEARPPDLVLMDVRLRGGMDGVEAARRIRSRHRLPVIYLTAYADDVTLRRSLDTQPYGYLVKPFQDKELRTTIEVALRRRQLEELLQESELKFRQLAEHIEEVFWMTDPAKRQMLYISPAYETIWGRSCDSLYRSPRTWLEAIHPDDRARVEQAALTRQADGFYDEEYRILQPGGALRWIRDQAFPVRNAAGKIHRLVGVARDITERKLAVEALREGQRLMEKAQQVGHIGSWVSDPGRDGKIFWSAETGRIFGFVPGGFDGRRETFFALVHPEDREKVALASRTALAGEHPYDLEHRIVRRDGPVRWVHQQADVERDAAGRPLRMVGVVQDITERKQLEERLRESQKMEAIGQLASGIAHDFNNLLGAIIGNAELAGMVSPASPAITENLEAIMKAGRRGADLVHQILAFSRRDEPKRRPMQLHIVVREALRLLRATVPATIEFQSSLAPTPTVLADASQIHQVIMNLCTNAWHAMRDRPGCLAVALDEMEVDEAFAQVNPDLRPGRYVRLTVADTGCGMDAATRARALEPFFTTKPPGEGTGLGLAVVHGIMKNHDGGLTVASQVEQGTTFDLYFPVFEAGTMEPAGELQPVPCGTGQHILFVDDEEPLARVGSAVLERLGYRVTTMTSATAALAAFLPQPAEFDLVVTDLNMPALNGADLSGKLLAVRPGLPIILTTGFNATLTPDTARERGFCGLLIKPYDFRDLGEAVHRVLNESNPAKQP